MTIVTYFEKCDFKFGDSENVGATSKSVDIDEEIPLRLESLVNGLYPL